MLTAHCPLHLSSSHFPFPLFQLLFPTLSTHPRSQSVLLSFPCPTEPDLQALSAFYPGPVLSFALRRLHSVTHITPSRNPQAWDHPPQSAPILDAELPSRLKGVGDTAYRITIPGVAQACQARTSLPIDHPSALIACLLPPPEGLSQPKATAEAHRPSTPRLLLGTKGPPKVRRRHLRALPHPLHWYIRTIISGCFFVTVPASSSFLPVDELQSRTCIYLSLISDPTGCGSRLATISGHRRSCLSLDFSAASPPTQTLQCCATGTPRTFDTISLATLSKSGLHVAARARATLRPPYPFTPSWPTICIRA